MKKEEAKVGQIYRYSISSNLHVRITKIGNRIVGTYVKAPHGPSGHGWYLGSTHSMNELDAWSLCNYSNCLKCNKRNPCKSMEVLCINCRK